MGRNTRAEWPCWVRPSDGATKGPRSRTRQSDAEPTAGQGLLLYRYAIPPHLCKLNDFELTSAVTPPATAARPPVAQGAASWWVVAGQQPPSKRRPAHGPMDS